MLGADDCATDVATGSVTKEEHARPGAPDGNNSKHHLSTWALEHVVALAINDKDANVRISASHQIFQLLTEEYSQGVEKRRTIVFVPLLQVLGKLVQDCSTKVHAAAVKDLCGLLNSGDAVSIPAEHVRALLVVPLSGL